MKISSNSWHLSASDPIYTEPEYLLSRIQMVLSPCNFLVSRTAVKTFKKRKVTQWMVLTTDCECSYAEGCVAKGCRNKVLNANPQ